MDASRVRRLGCLVLVAALAAALSPTVGARRQQANAATLGVPTLPPSVVAYALDARGTSVRQEDGLSVDSVRVSDSLATLLDAGNVVYRVTVRGGYRPRALRYVVRAGGTPVGYGVPAPNEHALLALTTDPAVLSEPITVRYGSTRAAGPAILPSTAPAPVGSGDLGTKTPGPFEVRRARYDFGDEAFQPAGLGGRVELRADVHYPAGLSAGPFPLVLFLHGNHSTCYRGDRAGFEWPCRPGWNPIPNYKGYDYIAQRLASYGFIVASVSVNGVNVLGSWLNDTGMRQRGLLLEKHLDLWNTWNTTGGAPFPTRFVGAVDMSRIGVMGHSRGGEGAVWQVIVDRNRTSPYGIDAVLPLAPVDFTRVAVNDVPLGVMLPYCDGDVWDLQGVHFFDDARYLMPGDPTPKATVTVFGANHNFFNTVWSPSSGIPGAFDDGWDCAGRLTETQQRRVGVTYITSFFRRYVGASAERGTVWTGETTPAAIAPAKTAVTYLAPDTPADRMDIDRFVSPVDLLTNQLGGDVTPSHMSVYGWCENVYDAACVPGNYSYLDIHLSWSWFGPVGPGLQEGVLGWSSTADGQASLRFDLPPGDRDVSGYDYLTFRTVPNPGYSANDGTAYQDLVVVLEDADGTRTEVAAADIGNDVLAYPLQGRRNPQGHIIMNQIRFPLSAFAGVDLSRVVAVELGFSRTDRGVIDVSDLGFMRGEA